MPDSPHPYTGLDPETILQALESLGLQPDGGMLALNSYENRVYQLGMEERAPLVAKFYRPQRWSDEAILEEHQFTLELAAAEIPVVAPLVFEGRTLHRFQGYRFALFPRRGGRWPPLEDLDNLEWIGRFLGRIHQIGASRPFTHRASADTATLGREPVEFLLTSGFLPLEWQGPYERLTTLLLQAVEEAFVQARPRFIRLHGDCHPGNILWTDQGPHFVDMDDCRNGPAIQDLWMLLSGERQEMALQLDALLCGYRTFADFQPTEVALIEPLRTLRMIHYAAWLARRWRDPAFPKAFPWFNSANYWSDHLQQLEQQLRALEQPPLPLY